MRKNNKLNDEDRQVLNGLILIAAYFIAALAAGLSFIGILKIFIK